MKGIKWLLAAVVILFLFIYFTGEIKETGEITTEMNITGTITNKTNVTEEGRIKKEIAIEMECTEGIVSYKERSFWNQEVEDEKFEEELIKEFKESIKGFGVEAKNCFVEFKESSTVLSCDVHGSLQHTWYDFDWFLRVRDLDFLDSDFERKEKELCWEGEVAGAKTTIIIKFPYAISNCHEHVWKK